MTSQFQNDEQNKRIDELRAKQEEAVVSQIARDIGMAYVDLSGLGINTDALRLVPETAAEAAKLAPFDMIGKRLSVAVQSPANPDTQNEVKKLSEAGYTVVPYLVSERSLRKAWARYADISEASRTQGGLLDIGDEALQTIAREIKANEDIKNRFEAYVSSTDPHKTTHLLEILLGSAIATKSSDVHFEAQEEKVRIRFRQDGVLQDIVYFDHVTYKQILSRIKLLSEMKITITDTAQDGRFSIKYKNTEIEIRVSTVPGPYGEGVVMRVLNPDTIAQGFDQLGINALLLPILQKEIDRPNGMILTTGPTGSGKTTTLYAFLRKIYNPGLKVMTIEDPIEYHLSGINQTQVEHEKGYDFLAGLRAALRQDPDVIMVGEIRDKETATIAVNASLTGHLVLSTLHTNNAAGTIPRLIDLGVQPGILGAALTVSMAQRLVRRLCENCKTSREATDEEDRLLRGIIKNAETLGKNMSVFGVSSAKRDERERYKICEAKGCEKCNMIGYKGRVGFFEAILTNEKIANMMTKQPTERDIKRASADQGIPTMIEDAAVKIIQGLTTIDEASTVIDLTEDRELWMGGEKIEGTTPVENSMPRTVVSHEKETFIPSPVQSLNVEVSPVVPWHVHELELLADYLKLLESNQREHPEKNISHKIEDVKRTIIEVVKSGHLLGDDSGNVKEYIDQSISGLEKLEMIQEENPNAGIADDLLEIRKTIENLLREVSSAQPS
jgi:type II secretory ATPase GspE/PulE/Tfp pilus assembly ATPase PilB-like protein